MDRIARPCRSDGCYGEREHDDGYCARCHIRKGRKASKIVEKREWKESDNFYNSAQWRKLSYLKRRKNPLCEMCESEGKVVPAKHVDHITPISKGGAPYDGDNLQSLCIPCHNRKTRKEEEGQPVLPDSRITIVWGAPCSGKSTYVREQMIEGDLVVDFDSILCSISNQDMHIKPSGLIRYGLLMREAIYSNLARLGLDSHVRHAWIVSASPRESEIFALSRRFSTADTVKIVCERDTCLARAEICPYRSRILKTYRALISDWFTQHNKSQ